jgi:hypothetical protein
MVNNNNQDLKREEKMYSSVLVPVTCTSDTLVSNTHNRTPFSLETAVKEILTKKCERAFGE